MKSEMAKVLRLNRERRNWSQVKAAKMIGVSSSTYRGWEAGRRIPTVIIPAIALAFETSISSLLGIKQTANEELASAIASLNQGIEHVKKALSNM